MVFYRSSTFTIQESADYDFSCRNSSGWDWSFKGLCPSKSLSKGLNKGLSTLSYIPLTLSRKILAYSRITGSDSAGRRSERKLNKRSKMTHVVSRTMSLIGVAFLIHFIIMSTFAENEGGKERFLRESRRNVEEGRRRPRSYRLDSDNAGPTPGSVAAGNLVGVGSGPLPHQRHPDKSEAIFTTENSTLVTAQEGSTANLPCIVRNLGNGVASWMRRRDYSLLTVGMGTITHDDRFYVSHSRTTQNWELHVKYVKSSDEGLYECQISTHPPSSIYITLRVVEARAEILGEPDKHVKSGSNFELVCVFRESTEPPTFIFWYHNDRMINYDSERGVVVNNDPEKSVLIIEDAQKHDSGNYTCTPSNARPTSISVHILNGEKPAAMQHGSQSHSTKLMGSSWIFVLLLTSIVLSISIFPPTYTINQRFLAAKHGVYASVHPFTQTRINPSVFHVSSNADSEHGGQHLPRNKLSFLVSGCSLNSMESATTETFIRPLVER